MLWRLVLAVVGAALGLFVLALAASLFLSGDPNHLSYDVYIDAQNRIFVNGEPASEYRVYELGRDMTVDFTIRYHPASTRHFCFMERGCRNQGNEGESRE